MLHGEHIRRSWIKRRRTRPADIANSSHLFNLVISPLHGRVDPLDLPLPQNVMVEIAPPPWDRSRLCPRQPASLSPWGRNMKMNWQRSTALKIQNETKINQAQLIISRSGINKIAHRKALRFAPRVQKNGHRSDLWRIEISASWKLGKLFEKPG
jgi:hypothetical protein